MTILLHDQANTLRQLAAQRSSQEQQLPTPNKNVGMSVFAVASGKGGVGKSSLVANLSVALANLGAKVLTIDGDLGLANLDLLLGIRPEHTLLDVVNHNMRIQDVLIENPVGLANMTVLPACGGRFDLANLSLRKQTQLLHSIERVETRFDLILIDTAAGIGQSALSFAAAANSVLLVVTPEPTSMADAYGFVKVLSNQASIKAVYLIANMVRDSQEGERLYLRFSQLLERFLGIGLHFAGSVILDSHVGRAVRATIPLLLYAPDAPASRCIQTIGQHLLQLHRQRLPENDGTPLFWHKLLHIEEPYGTAGTSS